MKRMLENCELLWDLNIKLGYRNNINAKAKIGKKEISKKMISGSQWGYPLNYNRYTIFWKKKEKGKEER